MTPEDAVVVANERMTAWAGAVLLVLIVVELASVLLLGPVLSLHVVVGVVLAGPLVVKVASTTFRFVRFYRRSRAFVERGRRDVCCGCSARS